jgi:Phage integrase family
MSSVLDVYRQLCTEDRLPGKRLKNFRTSVDYLAAAYETTPERLELTPEVEGTYKDRLRTFLTDQGKGKVVIRNTVQEVGQLLRTWQQLPARTSIPQVQARQSLKQARATVKATSPYGHQAWMSRDFYRLREAHWPADAKAAWAEYRRKVRHQIRRPTLEQRHSYLEAVLGYLRLTPDERLEHLHPSVRRKLMLRRYEDDREEICAAPATEAWADAFAVDNLASFATWHAWRIHTPADAAIEDRPPFKPSHTGIEILDCMHLIAATMGYPTAEAILAYRRGLKFARLIHQKSAPYHEFTFEELEGIAHTIMQDARTMQTGVRWNGTGMVKNPGSKAAARFMLGLFVLIETRVPLRIRNWVEAILDKNLVKRDGIWHWVFSGDELKIARRRNGENILDIELDPEVAPYLEEYLDVWRKQLPHADENRHVFLSMRGKTICYKDFYQKLRTHVHRLSGKWIYPHLFRTIFASQMLSRGAPINVVAYWLNDHPQTVMKMYNEMLQETNQQQARLWTKQIYHNGNGTRTERR